MGSEIVYCIGCSVRLVSADFQSNKVFRVDDQICCADCVEDVIADLPAAQQEKILNQHQKTAIRKRTTGSVPTVKKTTTGSIKKTSGKVPTQPVKKATRPMTRHIPRADDPGEEDFDEEGDGKAGRRKKILLLSIGGGGGLLLLIVILVLVFSGGDDKPPVDPLKKPGTPGPATVKAPAETPKDPEEQAKEFLYQAIKLQESDATDFAGRMGLLRKAEEVANNTPMADTVEGYVANLISEIELETTRIIENTQESFQAGDYGAVLGILTDAIQRHDLDEWRAPLDEKLSAVQGNLDDRFQELLKSAIADKKRGNDVGVQKAFTTLTKWGLGERLKELQTELSNVKFVANAGGTSNPNGADPGAEPEEKELSEAVKAYRETWELAMDAAFGRKYDEAIGRLEQARDDADDEDARKEAEADIKSVKQVAAFRKKALDLLGKIGRLKRITLNYEDFPKEYKEISGIVIRNHAGRRLELKAKVGEKKRETILFVELDAIRGSSLADYALGKGGAVKPADQRAAGLLSLIEGDTEGAKTLLAGRTRGIPRRYWDYARAAKEKAPTPGRLEFQARKLFHQATLDWREIRSWGSAMEKYRMLHNDFALAKLTQQNLQTILKRIGMGKEYLYFPGSGLVKSGAFQLVMSVEKATEGQAVAAYQNPKDIEAYRADTNYIDFKFYALPDHAYKVWVFAGACCAETFFTYFQSSEFKVREGGETVVLDPGSDYAMPLKMYVRRLKKTHKECKGEKKAKRWAWLQIPTPREYQAPGPKGVRLYNDQKAFSVAYALISSSRKREPTADETREFIETYRNLPKPEEKGVLGTPQPTTWLLAGPFDSKGGLNAKLPPETKFDPTAEMEGKNKAKVVWQEHPAQLRNASGGKVAVFNFKPIFTPNTYAVMYAAIHVNSPKAMSATLYYGSDDKSKVFVNGKLLHTNWKDRAVKVDEDKVAIRLREGWNRILIKVFQGSGEWGLAVRIADARKKPIEGLLYHPFGELD